MIIQLGVSGRIKDRSVRRRRRRKRRLSRNRRLSGAILQPGTQSFPVPVDLVMGDRVQSLEGLIEQVTAFARKGGQMGILRDDGVKNNTFC
jgi:hypothetical protein